MTGSPAPDAAWAVIEPLLPPAGRTRGRWRDHRQVLRGIVFKFRTGLLGRDLPERYGPWQTVHGRPPLGRRRHFRPPAVSGPVPGGGGLAGGDRLHHRAGSSAHGRRRGLEERGPGHPRGGLTSKTSHVAGGQLDGCGVTSSPSGRG
ncbi:transposase [Streptomyces sp. NPDC059071]|uniref:transposase n=1 Tax=unclassified Streptomyces TaxID=2593676 RepID=UPI0036601608